MSEYDYKTGKNNILEILNSKTQIENVSKIPYNEDEFTYKNGIKTFVSSMFIDIRDSTNYFKSNNEEKVARIIRAFCSEIISILIKNESYRQVGIRGDCVYAIYSTPYKKEIGKILSDAIMIETFNDMFQKILLNNNMPTFKIGIGLGSSKDLVIKAGKKGTGISDNIWIGDAVIDASKLSNQGNKDGFNTIVMDYIFYDNVKDFEANSNNKYSKYIERKYSSILGEYVYHTNMINVDFHDWIEGGMK